MQTTAARRAAHERTHTLERSLGGSRSQSRPTASPSTPPESPGVVTVFRGADGQMHHGWCGRTLEYAGRRARLELDFYCPQCFEHVSVPECTLARIPAGVHAGHAGRVVPLTVATDQTRRIDRALDCFGAGRAAA